jgi:hypothetical protein
MKVVLASLVWIKLLRVVRAMQLLLLLLSVEKRQRI